MRLPRLFYPQTFLNNLVLYQSLKNHKTLFVFGFVLVLLGIPKHIFQNISSIFFGILYTYFPQKKWNLGGKTQQQVVPTIMTPTYIQLNLIRFSLTHFLIVQFTIIKHRLFFISLAITKNNQQKKREKLSTIIYYVCIYSTKRYLIVNTIQGYILYYYVVDKIFFLFFFFNQNPFKVYIPSILSIVQYLSNTLYIVKYTLQNYQYISFKFTKIYTFQTRYYIIRIKILHLVKFAIQFQT
eukprot:TRINITY_DN83781_c0_g1_i1.p2 TRINITY_DN83781_c0_g1~~TRINITY_DN83781_c0_g1_i1.p2  ORF type:complete len:239 (+),score=-23.57 TRINITY_DN83781_c0_g1_i1:288-1004(+)